MEHLQDFQGIQGDQGLQGATLIADVCVVYTYKPYWYPSEMESSSVGCVSDNKEGYARASPIRLSPNFVFVDDYGFGRPHIMHSWEVL